MELISVFSQKLTPSIKAFRKNCYLHNNNASFGYTLIYKADESSHYYSFVCTERSTEGEADVKNKLQNIEKEEFFSQMFNN